MWAATSNARAATYPAPDTAPDGTACRRMLIPNDPRIIAALNDVICYLCKAHVWEDSEEPGGLTGVEVAALLSQMWHDFAEDECP